MHYIWLRRSHAECLFNARVAIMAYGLLCDLRVRQGGESEGESAL